MELEGNMASLEINEKKKRRLSGLFKPQQNANSDSSESSIEDDDNDSSETPQPRRSTRKKIRTLLPENRRVLTKPKKLTETSSLKDIENYYLDKRVKRLNPSLETIYEEPQQNRNKEVLMSTRKFKRVINFKVAPANNTMKIKKRKMKAKHLTAAKRVNNKKITLKVLMEKLNEIRDE